MSERAEVFVDTHTLSLLQRYQPAGHFEAFAVAPSLDKVAIAPSLDKVFRSLTKLIENFESLPEDLVFKMLHHSDQDLKISYLLSAWFPSVNSLMILAAKVNPEADDSRPELLRYNFEMYRVLKATKSVRTMINYLLADARHNFLSRLDRQVERHKSWTPYPPASGLADSLCPARGTQEEKQSLLDQLSATAHLIKYATTSLEDAQKNNKVLVIIDGKEKRRDTLDKITRNVFLSSKTSFIFVDEALQELGGPTGLRGAAAEVLSCEGFVSQNGRPNCRDYAKKHAPYRLAVFRPFKVTVSLDVDTLNFVQELLTPDGSLVFLRSRDTQAECEGLVGSLISSMQGLGYDVSNTKEDKSEDACIFYSFSPWKKLTLLAAQYSCETGIASTRALEESQGAQGKQYLLLLLDVELKFLLLFLSSTNSFLARLRSRGCLSSGTIDCFYELKKYIRDASSQVKKIIEALKKIKENSGSEDEEAVTRLHSEYLNVRRSLTKLLISSIPLLPIDGNRVDIERGFVYTTSAKVVSMIEEAWSLSSRPLGDQEQLSSVSLEDQKQLSIKTAHWLHWLTHVKTHVIEYAWSILKLEDRLRNLLGGGPSPLATSIPSFEEWVRTQPNAGAIQQSNSTLRNSTLLLTNDSALWLDRSLLQRTIEECMTSAGREPCEQHFWYNFALLQQSIARTAGTEDGNEIADELERDVIQFEPGQCLPPVVQSPRFSQELIEIPIDGQGVTCTVRRSEANCKSWKTEVALAYFLGHVW